MQRYKNSSLIKLNDSLDCINSKAKIVAYDYYTYECNNAYESKIVLGIIKV